MTKKVYKLRQEIPVEFKDLFPGKHRVFPNILFYRGLDSEEKVRNFLDFKYERLHDPFLMKDMEKAIERIFRAIEKKEKVVIYSDYDADGIPGGVMLREFFDKIGHTEIENYIPHRHEEGYGIHKSVIEDLAKKDTKLIISVDCGISNVDEVKFAKDLGVDVIITDHHEAGEKRPEAVAILDPKQPDCSYPDKNLCGSGVAFKLVQGILAKNRFNFTEGQEKWFLDLVGIATLFDMVPLTGENRLLGYFGLKVLKKSNRPGLQRLCRKMGVNQFNLSEEDITFSLAPRLNAASRIGDPDDAFKLLYTRNLKEADLASEYLEKINNERKGMVASLTREIKKKIKERAEGNSINKVVVMGNPNWRPALLGLVANSVVEEIKRPVFIWGRNGDNTIKGSCRSDGETNLVELMEKARDSFIQFGGHKMAGGFSLSQDKVHSLEDDLNKVFGDVSKSNEEEIEWLDAELSLEDVDEYLYRSINELSPFGLGNPKPIFHFANIIPKEVGTFGKEKNHLQISFEREDGKKVRAIKFFSTPESFPYPPEVGKPLNLIGTLEQSFFRNSPELRLRVIDII